MAKAKPTKTTPKKRRTAGWQDRFIAKLAECGNVSLAAGMAGINRQYAYQVRDEDPKFADAWANAEEVACDLLESEARRRAFEGVEKPIIKDGKIVATYREYSDVLLIFLLKAHRPEKFRERYEFTGANGGPIRTARELTDQELGAIAAGGVAVGRGKRTA